MMCSADLLPLSLPLARVAVRLHPDDNVAVAKSDLPAGLALDPGPAGPGDPHVSRLLLQQAIPAGHKLALRPIAAGEAVRRYGQVIAFARLPIAAGEHVHIHNAGVEAYRRDAGHAARPLPAPRAPEAPRRTFLGYPRAGGRAGTRNYVAVLSTVNCSAGAAQAIARHFTRERLTPYPQVDGVIALTHGGGCPLRQPVLRRTLAGMARHPNVAGWLLVGLGCETNGVGEVMAEGGLEGRGLVIQELGGLRRTVEAGIAAVEEMLPAANAARRTALPLSELVFALQCGGSDAWSGVTANPAVGLVADELVLQGGTVVLAETPEIYGAEHLLAGRAVRPEVAERLLEMVCWWKDHAERHGLGLDRNRSSGNEAGGLTTIYEKSLGAIAKAGSTPLTAVYDYAERVTERGFVFMNSPGFDPVSVTGQVAGGCTLVLFTTGRGSVLGFKPAPAIKIASTTALYRRMEEDMDLDAGRVLEGASLEEVAGELLELAVAVASGRPTKSEAAGAGEAEFCPWNVEGTL